MNNLLGKVQILQFIIIISFTILSNISTNKNILDKKSQYYQFLLNIIEYDKIIKPPIKKKSFLNIEYDIFLEKNEYFYFFYNKNNILTYFLKEKNSDRHVIYFNGFNNIRDIKTIINIVINKFTFDNIKNILDRKGNLYKIVNNYFEEENNDISSLNIFDFLYNEVYNVENSNEKIKLKIIGFSMGGPISQAYVNLLLDKYKDALDIEVCNIESWFGGNKKAYDKFKNLTNITNIYNKNSVLYFNNIFFQKYFNITYLLDNDNKDEYVEELFPCGIINYIKNHHLLSKIIN